MLCQTILSTQGKIWKMIPLTHSPYIIFEIRHADTLSIEIFAYNTAKDTLCRLNTTGLPTWYLNTWQGYGTNLFLHTYKNGAYSTPIGLWHIDLEKAEKPNLLSATCTPLEITDNGILIYMEKKTLIQHPYPISNNDFRTYFPLWIDTLSSSYPKIHSFVLKKSLVSLVGPCEYLETNAHIVIFGHYMSERNQRVQTLWIYSVLTGEEIYKLCTDETVSGYGNGGFIYKNKAIFTLSNKNKCIKLTPLS